MVPRVLSDWTLERLAGLLDQGIFEPESFDFKEYRTAAKAPEEKREIRKDCCAFANSGGGFLVYGVSDDRQQRHQNRLVGIAKSFDFPADFGGFPKDCKPSVRWEFLNPPVDLGNGKVIHVVSIPPSWRAPHCIAADKPQEGFVFPKRTNKGNEFMNYEEVRMQFLGYYEKRIKLQLLAYELQHTIDEVRGMMLPDDQLTTSFPTGSVSLMVIEMVYVDAFSILADSAELYAALTEVRARSNQLNNILELVRIKSSSSDPAWIAAQNTWVRDHGAKLCEHAEKAIALVKKYLSN